MMRNKEKLTWGLMLTLAVSTGLSNANIYYSQPLLGLIDQTFESNIVNFIPAVTQLGFALGLLLLVPFGDTVDRRRLILWQTVGMSLALIAAALAPSPIVLVVVFIVVGATATIAQQIIPLAAELAQSEERGRVVGTVMSG